MKTILTSALLFLGLVAFAQTPAPAPAASSTVSTALSLKAKSLCKEWSLVKTENFGDQHSPTDQQKNDRFILMENGRYRLIMNGTAEGGTWTIDKANVWITLTADDGSVKKFKVMESTDSSLKIDYRDADEIHNVLYYSTAAATVQPK